MVEIYKVLGKSICIFNLVLNHFHVFFFRSNKICGSGGNIP